MKKCKSCESTIINGIYCHEKGCPDEWKDLEHTCKWCGSVFIPDDRYQEFCDDSCAESYNS